MTDFKNKIKKIGDRYECLLCSDLHDDIVSALDCCRSQVCLLINCENKPLPGLDFCLGCFLKNKVKITNKGKGLDLVEEEKNER